LKQTITVAIADDHHLIRKSLALLIGIFDGIEVGLQAENGRDLIEKLEFTPVDVVLLDIQMPILDGFSACSIIRQKFPNSKVLMVSQFTTQESVYRALDAGAHGFVTKSSNPEQLEQAIRDAHTKDFYFDPALGAILHEIIFKDKKLGRSPDPLTTLSDRELEIVRMASQGNGNDEIAAALFIHKRTVETHKKRIMDKVVVKNFTGVILLALKYHYLEVQDL
jgi:two-component system response regulator DegU